MTGRKVMENKNLKCPKCGGEMEEGFIPNKAYRLDKPSWATKVKLFGYENEHKIKTCRCKNCGFLENYAN